MALRFQKTVRSFNRDDGRDRILLPLWEKHLPVAPTEDLATEPKSKPDHGPGWGANSGIKGSWTNMMSWRAGDSGGSGSILDLRFDRRPKWGIPSSKSIFPFLVEHPRPDLEQEMGAALAPPHLLLLRHPLAYDLIDR